MQFVPIFSVCLRDSEPQALADMLERLMAHNDQIQLSPFVFLPLQSFQIDVTKCLVLFSESITRFHSRSAPGIGVLDYLRRIVKFTNVEVSGALTVY